jgi:3-dehydroquinate synthetase
LYCINKRLNNQGLTNESFKLPIPIISDADMEQHYAATLHSLQDHTKIADENIKILSAEQRSIFDKVQKAYDKMSDLNTVKDKIQPNRFSTCRSNH